MDRGYLTLVGLVGIGVLLSEPPFDEPELTAVAK
jgi:hypothetical protein